MSIAVPSGTKISALVTNYLTHETFLQNSQDTNYFESSIFFIIAENTIKSFYINTNTIYQDNGYTVTERTKSNTALNNLYSVSSDFIYIPKYYIFSSLDGNSYEKSILFGFCNTNYFFSVYTFDPNPTFTSQYFTLQNAEGYQDKFDLDIAINKCSGSAYIGNNDINDRIFVSNGYSIFKNQNDKWNLFYDIKIFEFMVKTYEINYYVGKSINIELIDYTTIQQNNYDANLINAVNNLFNQEGVSFIKCKIINSYVNLFLENPYDKEIIILCLYYSKDLVNSLPNEPRLTIRLDLFKNNLGSNDLMLISHLILKNSIIIDKENNDGINYVYPEMITFTENQGELYVVLKGKKYIEIYTINLNIETLILSNPQLNLSNSYENNEIISFTPREYMGSFFFSEFDIVNDLLNVYIYGDLNKKNYEETKISLSPGTSAQVTKTEIVSLSNYLLSVLIVSNNNNFIYFISYPMCDPVNQNHIIGISSEDPIYYYQTEFIPYPLYNIIEYAKIFSYANTYIDSSINSNTRFMTYTKIEFDENYLSTEEKEEYLNIEYVDINNKNQLILQPKSHIENLKINYNLFFQDNNNINNKFYSPTCSFLVNICHKFCRTCYTFTSNDNDPKCKECLSPDYFQLSDHTTRCANIHDVPIQNYYFSEEDNKFMKCHDDCEYCIGPSENHCLKCSNNDLYLSEINLNTTLINNKLYEYSNCVICKLIYNHYSNYNFDDLSSIVCLDISINNCPTSFPYSLDNVCYQNCKNTGTEFIYGNTKNNYCVEECDNDFFYLANNTCIDDDKCPPGFYYFANKFYCVEKCEDNLYHVKYEKENVDNEKYFELRCEATCPLLDVPYYFVDENNYRYCVPSCNKFDYYYGNEISVKYDIYYKNTLICYSKSQCNNYIDEYSKKKYVAIIQSENSSNKRVCVAECKEVSQFLLPQSFIDIENTKLSGIDCVTECPENYGNYSWTCIDCSSIYYFEYEKNCVETCPTPSYRVGAYPNKCFSKCPEDYPYADNAKHICYSNIDDVPKYETKCDKTKHLWYRDYDVNGLEFIVCLNDTTVYLTCDAVVQEYPFTNKITHECVKTCPDYTIKNEYTKFCELKLNAELDFTIIRDVLLTHELNNTSTKNESNLIIISRDANSEFAISFYLFNYSSILEKLRHNINPSITIQQQTNGDIRSDPSSPFYYPNGTEFIISDQCENLLRELYNIPYYNEIEYEETSIKYINGIKQEIKETKKYYVPQYIMGLIMDIRRDDTSQVEYKLYKPQEPFMELNLGLCKEYNNEFTEVFINIEKKFSNKVYSLFDEVYSYYINNIDQNFEGKRSKDYVYDIFNKNSDFFESPCTPFTSKYGTDILSKDRFEKFYVEINFCEENCTYLGVERSFKNQDENFILIKCKCQLKDKYYTENEIIFGPNSDGEMPNYNIDFQTIKSNFICFKKILNIKSIFTKENALGLISLICFLLIIALYIIQCMTSITHLEETLKMIRVGKYDHGLILFLNVKDYIKEQKKRDECYRRRKELKKVRLIKHKPKNMNIVQAETKIKKAENNVKLKFEGKEMIPDEKKDELEIIQDRIKDLEEKLKLKYEKKGMKNKKIKIKIKEEPTDIKKINQEIKISKKHLEDLRRQRREIELEKLKYHSFSSMGSLPPNPPKRILSEMPMLDEIDDDLVEITSKEKIVKKKHNKKIKKKDTNKIIKEEMKEKEESKDNNIIGKKDDKNINNEILSINKDKEEEKKEEKKKEDEEKDESINEEKKEEEKNSENSELSWETYDSNDPDGKNKKNKKELDKKNKEKEEIKKREIQKLLIEKRIKDIENRMELLPEEEAKQKKLLQKEKKKIEMLEKGLPIKEDIEIMNSENILNTEEKKDENNINNEITKNDEIPEENLSEIMKEKEEEENESEKSEKFSEQITKIRIKKKKDKYFKSILDKKYQFKYMRLFYEENPYNFARDYSIINFNDLFTSNDFFYIYVDVEMNEMIYRRAIKEDRRSFCAMYWSFIKYKNNFIFGITKDYFNFITIKIAMLILSISIYPLLSCLFINDSLIHEMYAQSEILKFHTIMPTHALSVTQYIFSPIIIEIIFLLLKKFVLTEKDIIDFIHKKKYHSNYVLQEMVKNHDVRDENDEEEKKKILKELQNSNKSQEEKAKEKDAYFAVDDNELREQNNKKDYQKEYEKNKTLINEIRLEISTYPDKINNRIMLFFLGAFLFTLFNFYYVTVFTMVYYNCIKKIILGTVIPLIVNFVYPFVNCFILVSLRYFALNRGFINLYKLSKILSYI